MASVSQRTLSWLWDVLQREYRDPQRTYADIAQTLALYTTFAPRTDVYTYENGASALLLHLQGTVSVNFRGNQYRFPVAIWVPHMYPKQPPMFYVTPTDDMMIRPGQHVSPSDGRLYHPYLARWTEAWERSTVADFLALLVDVFTREPPVMSRAQATPMQNQPVPPGRPPLPSDQMPRPSSAMNPASRAPPPPPKSNDQFPAGGNSSQAVNEYRPNRYDAPPPLPSPATASRPASISSPPIQNYAPRPQSFTPNANNYGPAYANQQNVPPLLPQQTARPDAPVQRYSMASHPAANASYQTPSYQHANNHAQQPIAQPIPPHQNQLPLTHRQQQTTHPQYVKQAPTKQQQPNIMDDSPFEVTLSAKSVNLPTPAIPPNPEKQHILQSLQSALLTNLQSQVAQSSSALTPLQSQHTALQIAYQTLQQELNQLQVLQSQLQQNVESLNSTISAADRTITSAKSEASPSKIPSIDDLVIPPTVVARQLYDGVAEQRGYEAAIFALTEGFVRGRIGGEMWARKTRECAREEFRRKWLVKRIAKGMGLDTSQIET